MSVLRILGIGAGSVGVIVYFALAPNDPYRFMRATAADLRMRTVPPGATNLSSADLVVDQQSARASWEFETEGGWSEYCQWVQHRCLEFKATSAKKGNCKCLILCPETCCASPSKRSPKNRSEFVFPWQATLHDFFFTRA